MVFASVGTWLLRLVSGWLPLGSKPIGEWLGKILWVVGIFLVCMIVWNKFTKPTSQTNITPHQEISDGGQVASPYHNEVLSPGFGGCASVRVIEYYREKSKK
jgi:hypothetical protein